MPRKKSKAEYIEEFNLVHKGYYDYSEFLSIEAPFNNKTKIPIICPNHGVFKQRITDHKDGQKCRKCSSLLKKDRRKHSLMKERCVEEFKALHGCLYDYSKFLSMKIPVSSNTKIPIICSQHGVFMQRVRSHKAGQGCPKCSSRKILDKHIHIQAFNKVHISSYDYSKFLNSNALYRTNEKIPIICPKHGLFYQSINDHKKGNGCPRCRETKGERKIRQALIGQQIKFSQEHRFEELGRKRVDFYLPEQNAVIEYHGKQHYMPIDFFGGSSTFEKCKRSDLAKKQYCKDNGIHYIEIPYTVPLKDIDNYIKQRLCTTKQ